VGFGGWDVAGGRALGGDEARFVHDAAYPGGVGVLRASAQAPGGVVHGRLGRAALVARDAVRSFRAVRSVPARHTATDTARPLPRAASTHAASSRAPHPPCQLWRTVATSITRPSHHNIARVYAFLEWEGSYYLVMEEHKENKRLVGGRRPGRGGAGSRSERWKAGEEGGGGGGWREPRRAR